MQRQTLLVSIAVFALLASAIWFFAAPAPRAPTVAATPVALAGNPVRPVAAVAPASATAAPPLPDAPVAATGVAATTQNPVPVAATSGTTDAAAAMTDAARDGDAPVANEADAAASDAVSGTTADGDTPEAAAAVDAQSPARADTNAPAPPDGSASAPPSADAAGSAAHDRAVDLFAERIAALESTQGADVPDARAAAAQRAYEERAEGGEASNDAQAKVRDAFATWLAGLAFDSGHPSLIAVDCRSGACRVLIAQGGVDFGGAAQLERESPVNAFTRALADFAQGAVWRDAHYVLLDNQMTPAGGTAAHGNDIALWTIYLRVPTADAP